MIDSIQQFCGNGVKRLTNIFKTYTDDLTKIAGRIYVVTDEITRLGCNMIAEASIRKEAAESSYRKGGANAGINGDSMSEEAVMKKLHRLEFPAVKSDEKKGLKTIYIDADEDHVSLQYLEHKGDAKKPRINTVMPRMIYVYEGADSLENYSGQFKLRIPRSLHRILAEHAKREGVSMNQYCVYLLSRNDAPDTQTAYMIVRFLMHTKK